MTSKFTNGLFTLSETKYDCGEEYVLLEDTGRYHKVYYTGSYRKDSNPYVIINNCRYHLSDFIRVQ